MTTSDPHTTRPVFRPDRLPVQSDPSLAARGPLWSPKQGEAPTSNGSEPGTTSTSTRTHDTRVFVTLVTVVEYVPDVPYRRHDLWDPMPQHGLCGY